jgi:hypothetical protein
MARNAQNRSLVVLLICAIVGPLVLLSLSLFGKSKRTPQSVIQQILWSLGVDQQTIKYWTAVSAFETAGWTSRVFKESNNLFCLIVPGTKKLQYGEGQTIFETWEEAATALYFRVMKPFKYSMKYNSIEELVRYMKQKNYFTSDEAAYVAGVNRWYNTLYNA